MVRMVFFIFQPLREWETVLQSKRGMGYILGRHLLPAMLVAAFVEGVGMAGWRQWHAGSHGIKNFTAGEVLVWESLRLTLMLGVIGICAWLIKLLAESFNTRYTYRQALTVVIYSLSPLFLLRPFGAVPWFNLWIPWFIGIFLSLKILYYGLPMVLQSESSHALGMYFISSLFLIVLTGSERLVFIRCLNGHGVPIENLVFDIASKLPF
jgi:hypothetical protein